MRYTILCFFLLFSYATGVAQDSGDNIFDNSVMHEVRMEFSQSDYWQKLNDNYLQNPIPGTIPYLLAKVTIDGEEVDSVGVRLKGFTSYGLSGEKKPFKIDFNEFVSGKRYDGLRKINLNNGFGDPALQRDPICYDLHRSMGVAAPRTSYAKVYLNDQYWGCYQLIEQVDKEFLQNNFSNDDGNLFKNLGFSSLAWEGDDQSNYDSTFYLKTNEEENDWSGFINFLDVLNNTPDSTFKDEILKVFNVNQYLKVLAVDVATLNWDSYLQHGRNWYFYEDRSTGIFHWIPWDYNFALKGGNDGGTGSGNNCMVEPSIVPVYNGTTTIKFLDNGFTLGEPSYLWDFGDGNSSTERSPTHTFAEHGEYNVCLEVSISDSCRAKVCLTTNTYNNLADCDVIKNDTIDIAPDETFAKVIDEIPSCCETWGSECQDLYNLLTEFGGGPGVEGGPGGPGGPDVPGGPGGPEGPGEPENPDNPGGEGGEVNIYKVDQRDNHGVLIKRLLNVSEFYDRYLAYFCSMTDDHFTSDRYFGFIDANKELIDEAVQADTITNYTYEAFLADIGDEGIKKVISERQMELIMELDSLNACSRNIPSIAYQNVTINEFVASNDSTSMIADKAGEYDDWIELYNNTSESIDLSGAYLSDRKDNLLKWQFPYGSSIKADEYLIVWADKDEDQPDLHCNFNLSKGGEQIYLSNANGTVIDSVSYGEQTTNVASARIPNGTGSFVMQAPTFEANNQDFTSSNEEAEEISLNIYPNPCRDYISIESESRPIKVSLYNLQGQVLLEERNPNGTIDMSSLPKGMLLLQVHTDKGLISRKLIKA